MSSNVALSLFKHGKLPWRILGKLIELLPREDVDVIMGPAYGEDAAVIRLNDGFLVVHCDPITAATRRIGWLAIHIAANDVAVRGVKPRWFLSTILIPDSWGEEMAREVFYDMARALEELNAVSIGGHTEVTPGLSRPIATVVSMGYTFGRVVFTRDAKPGDVVLTIGRVAGEGAGVAAWDFESRLIEAGVDKSVIQRAKRFIEDISVVEKALAIRSFVNSMHDPTEGGVLQGLREVASASGTDIVVDLDKFRLDEAVEIIVRALGVDPFRLLSSGVVIATIPQHSLRDVEAVLDEKGFEYSVVGEVREGSGRVFIRRNGNVVGVVEDDIIDEIYKLWA